ncbi:MAG: ribulose-phosphate 3-epimerase [Chloroflexi bacterium]|nr:ribulose-phosphate 3-epimerase [Chloroflexota bacterium]
MPSDAHIKIAPSILSADFGRLGQQIAEAENGGADYIHVDIMDGHFVPNLTFGPLVVRAIRPWTKLPLDVHMMIASPEQFIAEFVEAGADIITVHAEACAHLHRVVHQIKESGAKAGVAINPATPLSAVEEVLPDLDQVLVMTVNPGFGGQAFIGSVVDKIKRMRAILDERGLSVDLEVDGGISTKTARTAAEAGARVLVAGSAVYNNQTSVADAIANLRKSIS